MRCNFCGAEIKEGHNTCEYCGSAVENNTSSVQTTTKDVIKPIRSIMGMIVKGITILACVWAVVGVISLIVVINSDVFKDYHEYSLSTDTDYEMPRNEMNLTGQILSCDKNGVAVIDYQGHTYEDVAILDKSLIKWINDTDRKLDMVEICFATDGNGDVSELGLLSADFFIMAKEEERYLAIRKSHVISFTSETLLEEEHYYSGFFSYPDMRLYSAEEKDPLSISYMDPKCESKESVDCKEYYTGEEITVYKIMVEGKWYCCNKETYDDVEIGDLLNGYEMYPNQVPAFIVKNASASNKADADAEEISAVTRGEEQPKNWRDAYQMFLDDWKRIEKYGDFDYLEFYFGEDGYNFDKYFLCDVDENGIPELFLYSTYMRLTAVFTYEDESVFLMYDNIYGINTETDEVVIQGHWHGAGGSGINEWSAYHISGIPWEYSMYIDFFDVSEDEGDVRYTIFDPEKEEYTHPQDSTEYDALYAAHVEPCILAEDYLLYDLSDLNGFDHIQ